MDIGEPQKTKIVEPAVDPVPREVPAPEPVPVVVPEPVKVPA